MALFPFIMAGNHIWDVIDPDELYLYGIEEEITVTDNPLYSGYKLKVKKAWRGKVQNVGYPPSRTEKGVGENMPRIYLWVFFLETKGTSSDGISLEDTKFIPYEVMLREMSEYLYKKVTEWNCVISVVY